MSARGFRRSHDDVRVGSLRIGSTWEVRYAEATSDVALAVEIAAADGRVRAVWTGHRAAWPRARGIRSTADRNAEIALLVLSVLFVAPFVSLRSRIRLVHLDLAALTGLSASAVFLKRGALELSVIWIYPPMLYLAARALWIARNRTSANGPLVWMSTGTLTAVTVLVWVARAISNLVWGPVSDVGYGSVFGASSIHLGYPLYSEGPVHGPQAYGPFAFLAYLPFELIWPLDESGIRGSLHAAHAAAIAFDLLTAAGLWVLGRRLRPGPAGTRLGTILAFAWTACPLTFLPLFASTNDVLVPLLIVWTLVCAGSPWGRGLLMALATAAKIAPALAVPLLARVTGDRPRQVVAYGLAFTAGLAAAVLPYVPLRDLDILYEATVGYAASRSSPFSVWGLYPSLEAGKGAIRALALLLAVAFLFVPRDRDVARLAALTTVVLILAQLGAGYWAQPYASWFVPTALVAVVLAADGGEVSWPRASRRRRRPDSRASAWTLGSPRPRR